MFSRKHLSYSSIHTLATCPRRFKYQYIDQRPGVLTSRLVVGTVYHNTLALALNQKRLGLPPMDHVAIAEAFSDFWVNELKDKVIRDEDGVPQIEATNVDWGEDDPEILKSNGTRLAQKYNHIYIPKLMPIEVEYERNATVEGIPLPITGRLDLELPDKVIDHKFKGKNAIQKAALERDMQSMVYALLKGAPLTMEFHQAIEHMAWVKFPIDAGLVKATITRTASDVEWLKELLREYWRQIEAEIFPPNPTSFLCSIDWCPYYVDCKIEG